MESKRVKVLRIKQQFKNAYSRLRIVVVFKDLKTQEEITRTFNVNEKKPKSIEKNVGEWFYSEVLKDQNTNQLRENINQFITALLDMSHGVEFIVKTAQGKNGYTDIIKFEYVINGKVNHTDTIEFIEAMESYQIDYSESDQLLLSELSRLQKRMKEIESMFEAA